MEQDPREVGAGKMNMENISKDREVQKLREEMERQRLELLAKIQLMEANFEKERQEFRSLNKSDVKILHDANGGGRVLQNYGSNNFFFNDITYTKVFENIIRQDERYL